MLAFLRMFLKFFWRIRHTDEMRSILEVVSEQLLYFYIAYKDMPYIQSQAIEVKESTQENKSKHIFGNICLQMRTYVLK